MIMRLIKANFENGDSITTRINGTNDEIIKYYVGNPFNLGVVGDNMQTCTDVEFIS
jgi:hypothetical protein